VIRHEIHKLYLNSGTLWVSFGFFGLSLFCFLLALGSEPLLLYRSAPPLIWILAILTLFFATPFLLKADFQSGNLDEILLRPLSPSFYLLAKIGAECLLLGLPLLGIGGLFACFLSLNLQETLILLLTLTIGFPSLSALGTFGGLLTLNARGGNILLSFLILPLTIPLIIFALSVMERTQLGLDSFAPFCLLISISLFLFIVAVGAGRWALSLAMEA